MAETYTLVEVEEMTGAERFAIQLWAREGLLQPVAETQGAGRGKPRRFSLAEVELAALMGRLAGYSSLDALRVFAKKYRARATGSKFQGTDTRRHIDAAREGDTTIYLSFILGDSVSGTIDVFRWAQTNPEFPDRILKATGIFLINLARAWSQIPREVRR